MAPAKILNVCNHRCFHLHCIGVFHCTSNYLRLQHLLDVLVGKLLEYGGEVDAAAAPPRRRGWGGLETGLGKDGDGGASTVWMLWVVGLLSAVR